ncbi:MAG: pyrroline-5-carboxylate reductase [Coriobacteriales bacterium]
METLAGLGTIAVLGCGKMGEAIVAGLVGLDGFSSSRIRVIEHTQERCDALAERYGVLATCDASDVLPADTLLVALKPQVAREVLSELAREHDLSGMLAISIAAGLTTGLLESLFPESVAVVRVMPNTPLLVQQGMSAVSGGSRSSDEQVAAVRDLFASIGDAVLLPEELQDASCALNGSGPAYFARACTALIDAGVEEGLDRGVAARLAIQTMYGTAALLMEGGLDTEQLVSAVSSPGGTTIAALDAMEHDGFSHSIDSGVKAAVRRSRELAG